MTVGGDLASGTVTAEDVVRQARAAGLEIRIVGEQLVVRGPSRLDGLARRVLACKSELLERFEERAAILEYDGGFSRDEAERRAREAVAP